MTDPVKPNIPDNAPQDVKDFFDCKGKKLVWKKGKVTWLGLAIDPKVSFNNGATPGSIDIEVTVGSPPFGATFTLPASVNASGELAVDTSAVPDLSAIGLGGPAQVDAAIKGINDWFKHNGYKLKGATLNGGEVTLEKTVIAVTPPAALPVAPGGGGTPPQQNLAPEEQYAETKVQQPPLPVGELFPPKTKVEKKKEDEKKSGGWCSLLGLLLLLLLVGLVALGSGIGFALFGGTQAVSSPTTIAIASLLPTTAPSTPIPTATPTSTPTATPTLQPTATPQTTSSPSGFAITFACARVVHEELGDYISFLEWIIGGDGVDVAYFELTVLNANDDDPASLFYSEAVGGWTGKSGLRGTGEKTIVSLVAFLTDGTSIDLTAELIQVFGGELLTVRFPQEDAFGDCPD